MAPHDERMHDTTLVSRFLHLSPEKTEADAEPWLPVEPEHGPGGRHRRLPRPVQPRASLSAARPFAVAVQEQGTDGNKVTDMPTGYVATTALLTWCTFFAVVAV